MRNKINNVDIRSITIGINWCNQEKDKLKKNISTFMDYAVETFLESKIKIRTKRLTIPPLNNEDNMSKASSRSVVSWISNLCNEVNIRWVCVPFDLTANSEKKLTPQAVIDIIKYNSNVFVNLIVTRDEKISISGVEDATQIIKKTSKLSNNGFDNFRVGVSANCQANTPFFPFAQHCNDNHGFSLALETVDMFISIIDRFDKDGINIIRDELVKFLGEELNKINTLGMKIEEKTGFTFHGIDASLAPFPDGHCSVGKILEKLGVDNFGSSSTLFFTSFLTNIIKHTIERNNIRAVGFNGVMYSLLEDDVLAKRAKHKNFHLESLALYSSVCGCGIDMIPLPGDILEEEIAGMIYDISAMAITLKKPLGYRVLPIPRKEANEMTDFNYDFLVDTRIMNSKNSSSVINIKDSNEFEYIHE